MDLERPCPACHGMGLTEPPVCTPPTGDPAVPCSRCHGLGTVPTDLGRHLLDFVAKHQPFHRPYGR